MSRGVVMFGVIAVAAAAGLGGQPEFSWRYYRPGNTGIQGDSNGALWVDPGGAVYIGGYDPGFEEGGFSRFIPGESRWVNFSNVDYPVIGHPDETGCTRVTDIVPDATGRLWLGTWLGALRYDPAIGPASLERLGPGNSGLIGDFVYDMDLAPDGSMWMVNGGVVRYDPADDSWTRWGDSNRFLSVQPKPGGGYLVWCSAQAPTRDYTFIFDSDTQQWTTLDFVGSQGSPGDVAGMPGQDCVDDVGNFWGLRLTSPGDWDSLDYRRPDGTWVTPPEPYEGAAFNIWAFKAYGDRRALMVDGSSRVYQFNGAVWTDLGVWREGAYTDSVDTDAAGNVWVCGVGGAAKRDAVTGEWQRYRVTNTANFDSFNNDLSIDPTTGGIYACANAAPGVGGMVGFDGERWTGFNNLHYGLGVDWPFPTDNSEAVCVRPSNGVVAVNPMFNFTHELDGASWSEVSGGSDSIRQYTEDSLGRMWSVAHYGGLGYYENGSYTQVSAGGWGLALRRDPDRPGTVWANEDFTLTRTDGSYHFSRGVEDFPEASGTFTGLAVDHDGVAWVGTWQQFVSTGSTLLRVDADTGAYQVWEHDQGWPFPGEHVRPLAVTPDGRLWMLYDSEYPYPEVGLCWWDGTEVGAFPAPSFGEPQWGGLPHASIVDLEVKPVPGGYELWMSCLSRGLAVLSVHTGECPADFNGDGAVDTRDVLAFLNAWGAGDPRGDFNGDGSVNTIDVLAFLNAWSAGC
ncbi:MAG: hypothetical protein IT431_01650 [Phycisphaerales bacterium]|nr:hypothetical protein [Phycisphaerales bacterium]